MEALQSAPPEVLLLVRSRINGLLPPEALKDMNLEEELVDQFRAAKTLQTETLADEREESNKKAQTITACAGILQQLIKMQAEFHTSERFKTIEGIMIRAIKTLPLDVATAFVEDYEQLNG